MVLKFDSKYVFDLHNLQQVPQLLLDHPKFVDSSPDGMQNPPKKPHDPCRGPSERILEKRNSFFEVFMAEKIVHRNRRSNNYKQCTGEV